MVMDIIKDLPFLLELIVLIGAAVGVAWGAWKGLYKPARAHFKRVNAGMDTLLGYPAVLDPGSGREIQPATPPLAARVYDLEDTHRQMVEALSVLAQNQQRLTSLEAKWDERERQGAAIVEEWMEWRATHEEEARLREARIAEWERWRVNQTEEIARLNAATEKEIEG